jgi:lipoprotein NlpI
MGANVRRLVLLLSVVACLGAADTAAAQTQPAKPAAAKKSAAKPATPPDTRPRYRRDDTPAAAAAAPAAPAKKQAARRRAVQPGAPTRTARATPRDAAACGQLKDPDAAITGCTNVIESGKHKAKGRAALYYNRGNAHAAKGDQSAAISDYDEAIKLDPKGAPAFNNRGSAKSESGDAEGAIADFDAAIKLNKGFASAYFNRGNVQATKGDTAGAIADYSNALKHDRRNVNAYIARGALYLATGAAAKARADMALATRLDRKNAYAVLWQEITDRRTSQKSVLARSAKSLDMKTWPAPVIRMFTGEIKQDAVLSAADDTNAALKQAHTCEANFYGAQYALIEGQRDEAVKLFEAAAKDCPHGFLEGIAATAELKGLGQKVGAN